MQLNTHCAGVKPDDRDLLVDEITLESPRGTLIVHVCRRCWHISSDEGETWGTPCAFFPGWHPFTKDVVLGGTHGVQICESCKLMSADAGSTWVKPAALLPRDLPTLDEVLPVPQRAARVRVVAFRTRRIIRYAGFRAGYSL